MFDAIPLDAIFSDPYLTVGAGLFILGPLLFLVALVKFVKAGKSAKKNSSFAIPRAPVRSFDEPSTETIPEPEPKPEEPKAPEPESKPVQLEMKQDEPLPPVPDAPKPQPEPAPEPRPTAQQDKTTVLPPEFSDLQGQIEICMSQIKTQNRKMSEIERAFEVIEKSQSVSTEGTDFSTTPEDPKDFMKKILKLAEHVIALEKEVDVLKRALKSQAGAVPKPATQPKESTPNSEAKKSPPPMPL